MTITAATADALDALALAIFNPQITPAPVGSALGAKWGKGAGLTGPDAVTDAQYYALIASVMLTIDGRIMPSGFRYTLNVTYALLGRPKHWYMQAEELDGSGYGWPASVALEYRPQPGYVSAGVNSFGGSLGLATCATICHAWATIIRLWLAGNYPLAISQPASN